MSVKRLVTADSNNLDHHLNECQEALSTLRPLVQNLMIDHCYAETRDPEYWFTAEFSKQSNPRGAVRHLLEVQDSAYLQMVDLFTDTSWLISSPTPDG
ncbi:hypothetical protein RRG08_032581 [Elysia crispata]|uniref:Uncharacterized protein n=1 Tax=Elysia crispata TaxID=231223 RepID=A0AAE1DPY8_9GAST|nr:hypothetical protein RRG08_032581 [Elysia crispata]